MKKPITLLALLCLSLFAFAQNADYKSNVTAGAFIQHYTGNLGSSLFKFKTTTFGGGFLQYNRYINPSIDLQAGLSVGDFGYSVTPSDEIRNNAIAEECPTCGEALDMDQLLGRMSTLHIAAKYKLHNDYILSSQAKVAPYIIAGMAANRLSDVMGRHCVTEGFHFSFNSALGLSYQISSRWNAGYQLGFAIFPFKKVYGTNQTLFKQVENEPAMQKLRKEKDVAMQNQIFIGFNF